MKRRLLSKRKSKILDDIALILLLFGFGLFGFFVGIFPKTIEIDPTGVEVTAKLYTRSIIPPFKKKTQFISNVKQAVIVTSRGYKGRIRYRVELEINNGWNVAVTASSWEYFLKNKLVNQINDSIKNRTPFTKTIHEIYFMLLGIFFIILSVLFFVMHIHERKEYKKIKEIRNARRREKYKANKIAVENTKQQSIEQEDTKYQNINDSIIK
jgi:ATP-dependent Zn protease